MTIEGQFQFENVGSDAVWSFLTDPDRIAFCLSGCEKLVPTGAGAYDMTMCIGIGAIRGRFKGTIALSDIHPPSEFRMTVAGSGAPGFVNGNGLIRLAAVDNGTQVHYSGNVNAGGAIASVGQRMISGAARMVIDRFFKCVAQTLNGSTG